MQESICRAEYDEGILILRLSGDIDHHTAKKMREEIDTNLYLYRASTVIIDLSEIDFMDSSGLGLILGRHAKIKDLGGRMIISDPSPRVERILNLAGTEKIIKIKRGKGVKNEKIAE